MDRSTAEPPEAQRRIYGRTPAGDAELAARELALSASARRLLVLVDGRRSAGLLSSFVRVGEFELLIGELLRGGLVEATGLAELPDEAGRLARQLAETAALQTAKQRLQSLFEDELGPAGHVWDARVADSVNSEVLRRVLREGVDVVFYRNGEAAARRIVAAIRPVFEASRLQRL
jgi:hypothetical protein